MSLTGSRITWFAITFVFVLPSMLLLFRSDDSVSGQSLGVSTVFAGVIAVGAAALFGKGPQ